LTVAAVMVALLASAAAAAEVRLAYVDLQRALNECNAGKKARNQFRGEIEELQGKLQRQQSEVQALKDELEKKGMLMRDDERRNLQDEYAAKLREFESAYKNDKDLLQQKDNEITGAILKDLAYVVRNLGERDGYTAVLEKGSLLYAVPSIDITDQVIREYNRENTPVGSLGERDGGDFSKTASAGDDSDAADESTTSLSHHHHKSSISK